MAIRKKAWQIESFRCIYCNHKGEWVTVYVYAENFSEAFEYIKDKVDMWAIKEISAKLANGELVDKEIENASKFIID